MSKDEVSNEKREESNDRRGGDGEISEDFDRWSNKRYVEEFQRIFSEGDEGDGTPESNNATNTASEVRESESERSEYEGYEEW